MYSPVKCSRCTFNDATVGQPYRLQTSPSLAPGSWTDLTNFSYARPITISAPPSTGASNRFHRALSP